ncbi:unnamed protein product, partial [Meganyctiphanes norvegica]
DHSGSTLHRINMGITNKGDGGELGGGQVKRRKAPGAYVDTAMEGLKTSVRNIFTVKTLKQRIPVTRWGPLYNLIDLEGDVVAGLTVGLTVIPQGIAYASVAGLPPQYGLYSAFMGCFVYLFFGSCKDITIGPTAIMAIMTHEYSGHGADDDYEYKVMCANILAFLSGLIIFASGLLNLGFLITFISKPVIAGFTSAAAITIASSQLRGLFGAQAARAEGVIETWSNLFGAIETTRWQDLTLGIICIIILLAMRKMKDYVKPDESDPTGKRILKKVLFLCSVGRNAIVVIICAIISYALGAEGSNPTDGCSPFCITGDIKAGLPSFKLPEFSSSNHTFSQIMGDIGSGVAVIPLIAILENIAIASAFSGGKTIDATQEMFALGLCNFFGSFVSSMPVTGSFSRTAVNSTSGVRTAAGGVVTGTLVVLALAFLTPAFKYIPKATLSAVIICAVIFMIEYEVVKPIWRARKVDQIPLWSSFIVCLFWKLEFGILVGVGVNLAILLFGIARPKILVHTASREDSNTPSHIVVEPRSGLYFPSVDYVRSCITKAGLREGQGTIPIVVDCSHFTGSDYSSTKGVLALSKDFEKRRQGLIFSNISPGVKAGLTSLNQELNVAQTPEELHHLLKSLLPEWVKGDVVPSHQQNGNTNGNQV